jgi:hypothetical protein
MSDYSTKFSVLIPIAPDTRLEAWKAMEDWFKTKYNEDQDVVGIEASLEPHDKPEAIWVRHQEHGDAQQAAEFIQFCMSRLNTKDPIVLKFSGYSDQPVLDAFNSGAAIIRSDKPIIWLDLDMLIMEALFKETNARREA